MTPSFYKAFHFKGKLPTPIQDILNTASDVLKSIFSSKGYKYYDRVTESEELDFDDVIKQLKKLIKKYTR